VSVDDIVKIIGAVAALFTAIGGTFVSLKLLEQGRSTHEQLNSNLKDSQAYQQEQRRVIAEAGLPAVRDRSLEE
jgi:hypothetical protein